MQPAKEKAANVAASAKSGMEKTKAVLGEKAEKLTTSDPVQRQMATEKKEQRIHQVEMDKLAAQEQNAVSRQAAAAGGTTAYTATGGGVAPGYTTGTHGITATGLTGTDGTTAGVAGEHPTGTMTRGMGTLYPPGTTTVSGRGAVQGPNTRGRSSTGPGF